MKILLLAEGIFDGGGGGQTVYRHIIESNPDHRFTVFSDKPQALPANCQARRRLRLFSRYFAPRYGHRLNANEHASFSFFVALDYAEAVANTHFDIIEVPDFVGHVRYWKFAFEQFGVTADKWLLSAHGVLSIPLGNHWWPSNPAHLSDLIEGEENADLCFDGVYGISETYLPRYAVLGFNPTLIDPRHLYLNIYNRCKNAFVDHARSKAQVTFIGRIELFKSPPKFVELLEYLDPALYKNANFWGGDVVGDKGQSARQILQSHLADRRVECEIDCLEHATLLDRLKHEDHLIVAPSVHETFHLGALEALATGTPVLIGHNTGFAALIEKYEGAERFITTDLSTKELTKQAETLLTNWDDTKAQWHNLAASVFADVQTPSFAGLYDSLDWTTPLQTSEFCDASELWNSLQSILADRLYELFDSRFFSHHEELMSDPSVSEKLRSLPQLFSQIFNLRSQADAASNPVIIRNVINSGLAGGYHPVSTTLLAKLEQKEKNEALSAAYFLRAMRAGYELSDTENSFVERVLTDLGLEEEAKIFAIHHDPDQVYAYLQSRKYLECSFADRTIAEEAKSDGYAQAIDVTFVLTTLNAENKVKNFLQNLFCAVQPFDGNVELVVVESASTDGTFNSFVEQLRHHAPVNLSWRILQTDQTETIQSAWNRAIQIAQGQYFNFIGIDEVMDPAGLKLLYDHMESNPGTDWVVGDATVLEIDEAGNYVKDVMHYDRSMQDRFDILIESTKSGMVGTLMRSTIFENHGYFDPRYRCAGDTEHKLRILPFAQTDYIPHKCGTYLNWPEPRVTASVRAELEDFSAWYLFRSVGGVRYCLQDFEAAETEVFLRRTFDFTKSYKDRPSTDIMLADAVATQFGLTSELAEASKAVATYYRSNLIVPKEGVSFQGVIRAFGAAYRNAKSPAPEIDYLSRQGRKWSPSGDNLQEQHFWPWPVATQAALTPDEKAEQRVLYFVRAALKNDRRYERSLLARCLGLIIGDRLPTRKALRLLKKAWSEKDMVSDLADVVSNAAPHWSTKRVTEFVAAMQSLLGLSGDEAADFLRLQCPQETASKGRKKLSDWFYVSQSPDVDLKSEPVSVILDEIPFLEFTGAQSAIQFQGVWDTDAYPNKRLYRSLRTSMNRFFRLSIAFCSKRQSVFTISFLETGPNQTSDHFRVLVNGKPTPYTFESEGAGGRLEILAPPSDSQFFVALTEIDVSFDYYTKNPDQCSFAHGVTLDRITLVDGGALTND